MQGQNIAAAFQKFADSVGPTIEVVLLGGALFVLFLLALFSIGKKVGK